MSGHPAQERASIVAASFLALSLPVGADEPPQAPIDLETIAGSYWAIASTGGSCRLELRSDGRYSEVCFQGPSMTRERGRIQLGKVRFALWEEDYPGRLASPEDLDSLDTGGMPGVGQTSSLPPIWRFVVWGERRYLLSRPQLLEFCIAVAEGTEPRTRRVGSFYLREGDEARPVVTPLPVRECEEPIPRAPMRHIRGVQRLD